MSASALQAFQLSKRAAEFVFLSMIHVKLQITLHSLLHPVYRHPLAKSVYICQQGGPGAPGLKGDSGDSGIPVRTPSCPPDQATSISLRLMKGFVHLYVYFFFKGTQRSSGCNWSTRKIRKEGNTSLLYCFPLSKMQ